MNGNLPKQPNKNGPDDEKDMSMSKVIRNILIWLLVIVSLAVFLIQFVNNKGTVATVTVTEYQQLIDDGVISDAVVRREQSNYEFLAELKHPVTFKREPSPVTVQRISVLLNNVGPTTEALWKSKGISFRYEQDNNYLMFTMNVLPWVLLISALFILMRRMQSGSQGGRNIFSFNKSRARMLSDGNTKVTFADVAGADEAKDELKEIVDFLRDSTKYTRLGGKIPKGVLLLGPPGTGKTLLARAVAGEAGVPFFSISGADFVEMFVGVGASRVRDLFEQAQKNSPCIVFIDEIDAVGRQRGAGLGGGHDEREQTLNQLLVEMDGFEQNAGIIIIAATNRPDVLDPALLRPGRFDRHVVVDRPDIAGRRGILTVHTRKVPVSKDVNLEILAKATPGFSGADIANLVNEAALHAARRNSSDVTMFDFENAIDKVIMGAERKSMIIGAKEKESTAYHEIGHALAGMLLPHSDPVHKVTIIPRGRALGVTSYLPNEDAHTANRDQLLTRLITLMAGRAAELVVFNHFNSGASNDLERATGIAKKMVCEWGMSELIGPVRYASQHDEVFLGREMGQPRDHSEETARSIDSEVRRILIESAAAAEQLMRDNIELLHRLSKSLIERETLDASELQVLINGGELPPIVKDVQEFREKVRSVSKNSKDKPHPGSEGLALSPS